MIGAMKIAIPIWNDYVSSVFDFAHGLLLVDIENGREISREEVSIDVKRPPDRVAKLKEHGVDMLICGAISRVLANMITASGIQVLPYVTGRVNDVLEAYLAGRLAKPQFSMPGCWPGARKGFRGWRRGCRWRGGRS